MRGDRLRRLRENENISQEQLATLLGIGDAQIWRYEKGEIIPRSDVVVKIARFFNVSTDYMLGESDSPDATIGELNTQEQSIIAALRRGEPYEAVKIIVSADENAAKAH